MAGGGAAGAGISHAQGGHRENAFRLAALAGARTYVESPSLDSVRALGAAHGWEVTESGRGLEVDAPASSVGAAAYSSGVELHQLATRGADLEDVFLRLTGAAA